MNVGRREARMQTITMYLNPYCSLYRIFLSNKKRVGEKKHIPLPFVFPYMPQRKYALRTPFLNEMEMCHMIQKCP